MHKKSPKILLISILSKMFERLCVSLSLLKYYNNVIILYVWPTPIHSVFPFISFRLSFLYLSQLMVQGLLSLCEQLQHQRALDLDSPFTTLINSQSNTKFICPFVRLLSAHELLYSIYRLKFSKFFIEIWYTDLFWSRGERYSKWFGSDPFFNYSPYNALFR